MWLQKRENLRVPAAITEGDRDAASTEERRVLDCAVWADAGGRTDKGTLATEMSPLTCCGATLGPAYLPCNLC